MERRRQSSISFPLECPFSDVGCNVILNSTQEYQLHLSNSLDKHLKMTKDLHNYSISGESPTEVPKAEDTSKTEEEGEDSKDTSAKKLKAVESEVEFLTDVLNVYGITQLPALECIKTQLKMPDVGIMTLGDSCTFRLPNMSQRRETGQKWLSPHFFVRGGHKMCLAVYPNGLGLGKDTHLSLKLVLLFDDQLEWPITLPSHLGIRVELMIESEGLFEDSGSVFEEDPMTATRAPTANGHHPEFTWKPRGERKSSSSSPSPKSPLARDSLASDKRLTYSFHRKIPATSLVRRASFNEKSSRKAISSEETQKRLSRILPPWCQQPAQATTPSESEKKKESESDNVKTNGTEKREKRESSISPLAKNSRFESQDKSDEVETKSILDRNVEREKKSTHKGGLKKALTVQTSGYKVSTAHDVDGATVFSMEKFASHEQIDKYTQEYNSLVFQITLCLV